MATRILVIDNDRVITEQLKDALCDLGYEVFVAQDGLEGLEINRQVRPQVIVLDVVLPKLDGFRFCRYLKEDPEFAEVPIIVLSNIAPEDMQRMIEIGALTALPKEPMAQLLPKLSRIIERILTNQRLDQEKRAKERTPRPEILRELMKERSHFQEIMVVLPDGFVELDSMHRVLFANAAACRLLKQNEVSIAGKNFPEIFPPEIRLRLNTILRSVIVGNALPIRETIPFENQHLKLSFASVSSSNVYTGAIVLIHDAGLEVTRMEELNRQNRQLQQMKQELERRFNAVQIIQRLSSEVQYPYGYPEIIGAILAFLPELMNTEITASLMQNADACKLHIFVKEDVGQEAINRVKAAMLEHFQSISGQTIQAEQVLYSFSGVSFTNAASLPLQSSLFAPIKIEENVSGSIGCFCTQPAAFTYFDEQLLGMFLNLTLNAVVDLRNLVESERKKMQAMVESMADGVLMTDQSDQLVVMNQAARKILHVSRKEDNITKKYFQDTLGFYPFHLTKGLIQRSGLQVTIKEEIKVFDKTLHSVVSPVYDQDGRQTGTVVVLRDITEQKEMEERKNDFLSVISHELRTPLASIGGSIDLVLEGVVGQINDKQKRYLELAKDSCQKLNVVIDDLLDISKFEKGKMEINLEPLSILQLVEEVTEKFQAASLEKNILLRLLKPPQDTRIYGDYNRLVQVMNNLLSNAIKFTPRGGEIEVRIFTPKVLSPHIGISVKDTGPGIRVEDLERVFDKFEQVRRSDTRKIGGTGLGLAISRSIIEAHRGKIWAESKPSEGAKFIFLLPVEKRVSAAPEIYADLSMPAQDELSAMIVAADADTAYLLKGILAERGMRVLLSYSAKEALNMIHQKTPHLIILDLEVDQPSAEQMLTSLSDNMELAGIPLITLSRGTPPPLPAFANFFPIGKPIEMNQFLAAFSSSLLKIRAGDKRRKILLIDDDPNMRMICREALQYQNFNVIEASSGSRGLELLKHHRPDLILLDIMMPDMDGLQIAQIVKSNISMYHIPIIFLTAKGQTEDKVKALKAGGSDYLVKPFDSTELAARIETILERTEKELSASPTTKLPGSTMIEKEINRLIERKQNFALSYLDLDNLKAYNDDYGYAKADGVIKQTGEIIREVVQKMGAPSDFAGHIAGDDFVFISQPELMDNICMNIIERFDLIIPFFYNPEDRERGYIEAEDRYGVWRKFPILSISIVCLTNEEQELTNHLEIATLAAEYKRLAKGIPGSVYIRNGKTVAIKPRPTIT